MAIKAVLGGPTDGQIDDWWLMFPAPCYAMLRRVT